MTQKTHQVVGVKGVQNSSRKGIGPSSEMAVDHSGFLRDLLFDSEYRGDMFLRNVR
jgi:hypothetical protein